METKWYSDYWALIKAPKSRGFKQVIEHGTTTKAVIGAIVAGFALPVVMILLVALAVFIVSLFTETVSVSEILSGSMIFGAGAIAFVMMVGIGLVISHAFIHLHAAIFKRIANRLGGQAEHDSLVTNFWYIAGYSYFLSLVYELVKNMISIVFLPSMVHGSTGALYTNIVIQVILGILMTIWSMWFTLSFTGTLVKLNKLQTFLAYLLSAIAIGLIIFVVLGLPILVIMWARG